jgi:hypothetical protein
MERFLSATASATRSPFSARTGNSSRLGQFKFTDTLGSLLGDDGFDAEGQFIVLDCFEHRVLKLGLPALV